MGEAIQQGGNIADRFSQGYLLGKQIKGEQRQQKRGEILDMMDRQAMIFTTPTFNRQTREDAFALYERLEQDLEDIDKGKARKRPQGGIGQVFGRLLGLGSRDEEEEAGAGAPAGPESPDAAAAAAAAGGPELPAPPGGEELPAPPEAATPAGPSRPGVGSLSEMYDRSAMEAMPGVAPTAAAAAPGQLRAPGAAAPGQFPAVENLRETAKQTYSSAHFAATPEEIDLGVKTAVQELVPQIQNQLRGALAETEGRESFQDAMQNPKFSGLWDRLQSYVTAGALDERVLSSFQEANFPEYAKGYRAPTEGEGPDELLDRFMARMEADGVSPRDQIFIRENLADDPIRMLAALEQRDAGKSWTDIFKDIEAAGRAPGAARPPRVTKEPSRPGFERLTGIDEFTGRVVWQGPEVPVGFNVAEMTSTRRTEVPDENWLTANAELIRNNPALAQSAPVKAVQVEYIDPEKVIALHQLGRFNDQSVVDLLEQGAITNEDDRARLQEYIDTAMREGSRASDWMAPR